MSTTKPTQLAKSPAQRIIRLAQALFLSQGIQPVTMDDVAAHLGMSKKTLYKYFVSKPALVHAAIGAYADRIRQELGTQNAACATAVEEMLVLRHWLRQEFGQVRTQVFRDLEEHYPATWQLWQDHSHHFVVNHVRNNLRWGMLQELYRPDLKVDFLARLWLREVTMGLRDTDPDRLNLDPVEMQQTLLEHFLTGIMTDAGTAVSRQLQPGPPVP